MYSVGLYILKVSNENPNHQFINLFIVNYQYVFYLFGVLSYKQSH